MRSAIVALANRAHRKGNPFARRGLLSIAVAGLILRHLLFWIAAPLLMIVYPIVTGLVALVKAAAEVPPSTIGQFKSDVQEWRRDWPGIKRIWRSQKIEPAIERASHD